MLLTIGIHEGDPLGPLFLSLVLMLHIQCQRQLHIRACYLDDRTLIGETKEVVNALSIIRETRTDVGFFLYLSKMEIFWPSVDLHHHHLDIFFIDISCSQKGVG